MLEGRDRFTRQTSLKEYALLAPRLLRLLGRLLRDPRVPARNKAVLLMSVGYLLSPIDIIPDRIKGVGRLDDLVVLALALDHLLNRVPDEVVKEHWDGEDDVLELIRSIVDIGAGLVPPWLKRLLPS
jgi:uncharacterized membrane protein YkvA (DUF1232 family)